MPGFNPLKVAFDVATFIPKTIISIPGKVAEHREELERRRKLKRGVARLLHRTMMECQKRSSSRLSLKPRRASRA